MRPWMVGRDGMALLPILGTLKAVPMPTCISTWTYASEFKHRDLCARARLASRRQSAPEGRRLMVPAKDDRRLFDGLGRSAGQARGLPTVHTIPGGFPRRRCRERSDARILAQHAAVRVRRFMDDTVIPREADVVAERARPAPALSRAGSGQSARSGRPRAGARTGPAARGMGTSRHAARRCHPPPADVGELAAAVAARSAG